MKRASDHRASLDPHVLQQKPPQAPQQLQNQPLTSNHALAQRLRPAEQQMRRAKETLPGPSAPAVCGTQPKGLEVPLPPSAAQLK
mmetsp:Transcript_11670/g.22609  ORF Transcript_11670/g.22609 Transcript_11670/m.22609 type:complete len:85 (+) Transcript_11670:1494-1748(+)